MHEGAERVWQPAGTYSHQLGDDVPQAALTYSLCLSSAVAEVQLPRVHIGQLFTMWTD